MNANDDKDGDCGSDEGNISNKCNLVIPGMRNYLCENYFYFNYCC